MLWVVKNKLVATTAAPRSNALDMNASLIFGLSSQLLFEIYKHFSLIIKGMRLGITVISPALQLP
jgi:hypothetical protein